MQVLEVELAGARDDLQSAEDAQRAAVCAESVAVDSAEALKTKLRWANEVGFITVHRRHVFVFAYIKRAMQSHG